MRTPLTIDSLGPDTTEADLARYIDTYERILPAFDGPEAAQEWLWNNGDFMARIDAEICIYCDRLATERNAPTLSDDDAWVAIASEHAADCEWVTTRAHRA
jgi:hypothetical protein